MSDRSLEASSERERACLTHRETQSGGACGARLCGSKRPVSPWRGSLVNSPQQTCVVILVTYLHAPNCANCANCAEMAG